MEYIDSQTFLENQTYFRHENNIRKRFKLKDLEKLERSEWDEYEFRKEYEDMEENLLKEIQCEESDDIWITSEPFSYGPACVGYKYVKSKEFFRPMYIVKSNEIRVTFDRNTDTIESCWIDIPKFIYDNLDCNNVIIELNIGGQQISKQSLTFIICNSCLHDEGIECDEENDIYKIKILSFENFGKFGLPIVAVAFHEIKLIITNTLSTTDIRNINIYWYGYAIIDYKSRRDLAFIPTNVAMIISQPYYYMSNEFDTIYCGFLLHGAIILSTENNCEIEDVTLVVKMVENGTQLLPWIFTQNDMLHFSIVDKTYYILPLSPEYSKFEGIQDKANEQNIHGIYLYNPSKYNTKICVRTYERTKIYCECIELNYVTITHGTFCAPLST